MKPEDMTREQLEEVARCARNCWSSSASPDPLSPLGLLFAALNPSPLPSDEELRCLTQPEREPGNYPYTPRGARAIYAHALRLAADLYKRPDGHFGTLLRNLADEMENR
jgi:hypothetical protein